MNTGKCTYCDIIIFYLWNKCWYCAGYLCGSCVIYDENKDIWLCKTCNGNKSKIEEAYNQQHIFIK